MKEIQQIHFRYLTDADFFNLNKPPGTEDRGGGQTYIDFPARQIPVGEWVRFFDGVRELFQKKVTHGNSWEVPVQSIGLNLAANTQRVKIYQRRAASVSIASQILNQRSSNRILAWLPKNGFPQPRDPIQRTGQIPEGLCVYLLRTTDGEIWAGWFLQSAGTLAADETAGRIVRPMTNRTNAAGSTGFIRIEKAERLLLILGNSKMPFATGAAATISTITQREEANSHSHHEAKTPRYRQRDEQEILRSLFSDDESQAAPTETRVRVQQIISRNLRAVKDLKMLYDNRCQISGDALAFKKKDGHIYCEVHHLIPLGQGGADDPRNMIVVNPLIHKMLHYAEVTGINLAGIEVDGSGHSVLKIRINDKPHTIKWNQHHAERILNHSS